MKKYVRFVDGEKAVLEDFNALALSSGSSDDVARASMHKTYLEGSNRRGFVIPFKEGPIVTGGTGEVTVKPFRAIMSAGGATSSAGTESASGGSEDLESIKSAFYAGGTSSISVALSGAGKTRWDLLYAKIAVANTDTANRLVKDAATGTTSTQSISTRTEAQVTLLWVQGTEQTNTDTQYLPGNLPTLPTPSSGEANVPLALVQVRYNATMSSNVYTRDHIANCAPIARVNEKTGAAVVVGSQVSNKATTGADSVRSDAKSIITLDSSEGGWPLSGSNIRPTRFWEPISGGISGWLKIGPLKDAAVPADSAWHVFSEPLCEIETTAGNFEDFTPFDWRDRFFSGMCAYSGAAEWIDSGVGSTSSAPYVAYANREYGWAMGQSFRETPLCPVGYRSGLIFYDMTPTGAAGDTKIGIVVSSSTGKLHLALWRTIATVASFNNSTFLIKFDASDRGYGL